MNYSTKIIKDYFFYPMQIDALINGILRDASHENVNKALLHLQNRDGINQLLTSLSNNTILSFIFLKQYAPAILSSSPNLLQNDFVPFLVSNFSSFNKNNRFYVFQLFEYLSGACSIPIDTLFSTIQMLKQSPVYWALVDALTRKYRKLGKSNELYREIKDTIDMLEQSFLDALQESYIDVYLLNCMYSLLSHDIHPFFEDNYPHFFSLFDITNKDTLVIINDIILLFISKYPEFTDFNSLVTLYSQITVLDPLVLTTLTKAYFHCHAHSDLMVSMLKRVMNIKIDDYNIKTKDMLRGVDLNRGSLYPLIRELNPDPFVFEGEQLLFVSTVLKIRHPAIIDMCISILKSPSDMSFSAFMYLITIQEFNIDLNLISPSYFTGDCSFIFISYLSLWLKHNTHFYSKKLGIHTTGLQDGVCTHTTGLQQYRDLFTNSIQLLFSIDRFTSDYTSELLFRATLAYPPVLSRDLLSYLEVLFDDVINLSVRTVNFLVDVYVSGLMKFNIKPNCQLVQFILSNEVSDLLPCALYFLSVFNDPELLTLSQAIFSRDSVFAVRELHLGLALVAVNLQRNNVVSVDAINHASSKMGGFPRFVLHYLTGTKMECDSKEQEYLLNGVVDLPYFEEYYLTPVYCRLVVRKLISQNIDARSTLVKNIKNIENENLPHFIINFYNL